MFGRRRKLVVSGVRALEWREDQIKRGLFAEGASQLVNTSSTYVGVREDMEVR